MSEWKSFKLSELGQIIGGSTPSTRNSMNYEGGHISWITPKDLSNHSRRFIAQGARNITEQGLKNCSAQLIPKNSILFSSRAPIGYLAIAEKELCTNQGFKSIVPNDRTNYMFLYYLLKFNKEKIEYISSGTTFKEISGSAMKKFSVCVPPLETQKKIAAVLSALDDKIELNNAINRNLEEQAQAIYKNMFVDNFNLAWRSGTLSDIAEITNGKRPLNKFEKASEFASIPIFGASSIMGYTTDILCDKKILITGRVGTHGIIQRYNKPCWVSDNAFIITSLYYEYCFQILRSVNYKNLNRGSTQPLITQTDLKKLDVILPSEKILLNFEELVGSLMRVCNKNYFENQKLGELRDVLLPRLMSGEIDVSAVEI